MTHRLLLVKEVRGEIIQRELVYNDRPLSIVDTRITCILEDNRVFRLERVPPDIVLALKKLDGEDLGDDRERLVDILISMPDVIDTLGKHLMRVVIDGLDMKTGVYTAIAEFSDGNIVIKRKMVPSHAIFLARLTNKPIYVREDLVTQQERWYNFWFGEIEDEYMDDYMVEYEEGEYEEE
ncbi:MAG: bifunctional nuclease domain-containing protein [Thermoprotei archaeon]